MTANRQPAHLRLALLIALGVVLLQALLLPLFAGPAARLAPRDLPIVVAGPEPQAAQIAARLAAAQPGAFAVSTVADAPAADAALRDRTAYAALVLGPDGVALHTASAAGPAVATLLIQALQGIGQGRPVPVTDVVPADPDDPRGAGFAAGFLPLAITSMIAAVAFTLLLRGRAARLAGLLGYAVLAGLGAAAVLQHGLGVLPGGYLANAAVIGLFALAVSATITGLGAALGTPGIGIGALLVFLVGNALSGISSAPELLPQPWGEVGQWLPVGAGGTLLRSVAFFDGAGAGAAAAVLTGYAAVGLLLVAVGRAGVAAASTSPAVPAVELAGVR